VENNEYILPSEKSETENMPNLRSLSPKKCSGSCGCGSGKLDSYDWLKDISEIDSFEDVVEVKFKNTRKAYFLNTNKIKLVKDDVVAVEASPGHDIGVVVLSGQLVNFKMRIEGINYKTQEFKRVYRKAKPVDIDKWKEALALENITMLKARKIASDLKLDMKIGDVEYQGDKTKAIFYYIANDRVDFRQLIKVLAEEFKVRIEMRQIGARQEAGRIGGIGSCGRELCCSSWMTDFVSVTTNAARYQEVSLNPQKLAGQCGKLKCCLNYELDSYLDAQEDFPETSVPLKTKTGRATHQKTDVYKRLMWYLYEEDNKRTITCMSVDTVKDIIRMNQKNEFPEKLTGVEESSMVSVIEYQNAVGAESITRFEDKADLSKTKKGSKKPTRKLSHKPHYRNDKRNNENKPDFKNKQQ
jgi:cell fate regulator YaaT (PSP1 superfamily)